MTVCSPSKGLLFSNYAYKITIKIQFWYTVLFAIKDTSLGTSLFMSSFGIAEFLLVIQSYRTSSEPPPLRKLYVKRPGGGGVKGYTYILRLFIGYIRPISKDVLR